MAEGEDGGWWRSWLQQSYQAVKEKSTEALEFMKRDLAEFTQVVQHDTACTIAATASVVKDKLARAEGSGATEKVRKGLSDFLGVISDTFAPSPDKTIDCDVITLMATPSGTTEPLFGAVSLSQHQMLLMHSYPKGTVPSLLSLALGVAWGFPAGFGQH
uniref:BSD domain containing 1 n=1 Tax=Taeniopygia guttata TaxID=59729 RepID=A0A674HKJ6_TAEGU